jgi:hypothetical protein
MALRNGRSLRNSDGRFSSMAHEAGGAQRTVIVFATSA